MQKIVSKYALAAHLAVMAVAPLFLLPFSGSDVTAKVLLWLSAFGFIWLLMEPSRRRGEMPHDARLRVGRAVLRDPLFWFSLVLVAYAGIRALNEGVGMVYDAEFMVWSLHTSVFPMLPGSVCGTGFFPFAVAIAVAVMFQATRHALGRSARAAFLLSGSVLSACAAFSLAFALSYRCRSVLLIADCSTVYASYFGTAFGLQFLCGLAALFATVENKWVRAEPFAVIGLVGNAIGLVSFAPPVTVAVFLVAYLLIAVVAFALLHRRVEGSGSFRCALAVLISLAAPVLYAMTTADASPEMNAKVMAVRKLILFPPDFFALRETLSAIALKTWKANPWIGTGLGSFPLDIRFMATESDWLIVPPSQQAALNGWWQLLAERGVIGALMIAVTLGMLLWTYVSRLITAFPVVRFAPEHMLGPVVLLILVAISFFDGSFLRPEVLLLAGALISYSGGALPENVARMEEGKEI